MGLINDISKFSKRFIIHDNINNRISSLFDVVTQSGWISGLDFNQNIIIY
jgi:hypothetical protein